MNPKSSKTKAAAVPKAQLKRQSALSQEAVDPMTTHELKHATIPRNPLAEPLAYQTDLWRRGLRYLDTLSERADNMLEHEQSSVHASHFKLRQTGPSCRHPHVRVCGSGT